MSLQIILVVFFFLLITFIKIPNTVQGNGEELMRKKQNPKCFRIRDL